MSIPGITALPTAPSRARPGTFAAEADAFLAALPTFATELTALAAAVDASIGLNGFTSTSTSSVAIGTGSKTFVTQAGKLFAVGSYLMIVSTANAANWMYGQVTAYDSSDGNPLTINVVSTSGSGTISSWNVSLSGAPSPGGTAGGTTFAPAGTIAATSVQAALQELDGDIQTMMPKSGGTFTGPVAVTGGLSATSFTGPLVGNASTASVAASCSGNAATATVAASCAGNSNTATALTAGTKTIDTLQILSSRFTLRAGANYSDIVTDGVQGYYQRQDHVVGSFTWYAPGNVPILTIDTNGNLSTKGSITSFAL